MTPPLCWLVPYRKDACSSSLPCPQDIAPNGRVDRRAGLKVPASRLRSVDPSPTGRRRFECAPGPLPPPSSQATCRGRSQSWSAPSEPFCSRFGIVLYSPYRGGDGSRGGSASSSGSCAPGQTGSRDGGQSLAGYTLRSELGRCDRAGDLVCAAATISPMLWSIGFRSPRLLLPADLWETNSARTRRMLLCSTNSPTTGDAITGSAGWNRCHRACTGGTRLLWWARRSLQPPRNSAATPGSAGPSPASSEAYGRAILADRGLPRRNHGPDAAREHGTDLGQPS